MDIIDVEVELPPIPQDDLEEEEEFHGPVNLVAFPHQVKQYFERPNYFECFCLSKDVYLEFEFLLHFAEVHAIYNAHTCLCSISRINLNHGTTSLVKLTTRINPSLTLILDYFNPRLTLIW